MAHQSPTPVDGPVDQDLEARIDQLAEHVDRLDTRNVQLKNTLRAVAREAGHFSLGGVCPACGQSLTLMKAGSIRCPECGYQQSL